MNLGYTGRDMNEEHCEQGDSVLTLSAIIMRLKHSYVWYLFGFEILQPMVKNPVTFKLFYTCISAIFLQLSCNRLYGQN